MKDAFLKSLRISLVMLCMFVPVALFAQSTVSGTVYDADSAAVIRASVIKKGNPSNRIINDIDLNF